MPLKLMYITNRPEVALIAEEAGVDRIWIDMEYIGKDARQKGLNTVKNHHTIEDVQNVRKYLKKSELLVRINPIHDKTDGHLGTEQEINQTINSGADIIMLPMFKTANDVTYFNSIVNKRARKILLLETKEALENIDEILKIEDIDEIHIGLNDLHLALGKKFMFELITDGTVEKLCKKFKRRNIVYGFGGIARIGYGDLPSEYIIAEHYRLGSSLTIISRSFCDANTIKDANSVKPIFINGIKSIRRREKLVSEYSTEQFKNNSEIISKIVNRIISER